MKTFLLENCAAPICVEDIDFIENSLKTKLPESFVNLYLAQNGGNPINTIFPATKDWDFLEVAGFYPVKYKTSAFDTDNSLLLEHYQWLLKKALIPNDLLPFSHDPGGNFFCLNILDGSIFFFANDIYRSDISPEDNHSLAARKIADSFEEFIAILEYDELSNSDEWPD